MINLLKDKKKLILLLLLFLVFLAINTNWLWQLIYPIKYEEEVHYFSRKFDVDPYLVLSIAQVETRFNEEKVSKKGAVGPMQIMPETAEWIVQQGGFPNSYLDNLNKPEVNIALGSWYLSNIYHQFDYNIIATIAAYNAGPGKVRQWVEDGVWDGRQGSIYQIPIGETRHYIQRVLYFYDRYITLYEHKFN